MIEEQYYALRTVPGRYVRPDYFTSYTVSNALRMGTVARAEQVADEVRELRGWECTVIRVTEKVEDAE
jgi:hypothetical protein